MCGLLGRRVNFNVCQKFALKTVIKNTTLKILYTCYGAIFDVYMLWGIVTAGITEWGQGNNMRFLDQSIRLVKDYGRTGFPCFFCKLSSHSHKTENDVFSDVICMFWGVHNIYLILFGGKYSIEMNWKLLAALVARWNSRRDSAARLR